MSSRFDEFIEYTLDHEGGFVDHPSDPGGATNWGISLRFLREVESASQVDWDLDDDGDVDAHDIKLMTRNQAKILYREHFWFAELDELADPDIAAKLFDMGVNMGRRQAAKIAQRAIWRHMPVIEIDGFFGPKSRDYADVIGPLLALDITHYQAKFYFDLVNAKRSREVFLVGWLRRAYWLPYDESDG